MILIMWISHHEMIRLVRVRRAYLLGPVVYAASVLAALWNAAAGLAICTSLWLVWTRLCYHESRRA